MENDSSPIAHCIPYFHSTNFAEIIKYYLRDTRMKEQKNPLDRQKNIVTIYKKRRKENVETKAQ